MEDTIIKEKLEAIWPEVIGAVVTKKGEVINLCPINYQAVSTVYEKPLTVCIGLDNRSYTLETILAMKEFVYAYPSYMQLKDIIYCGTVSGRDIDKIINTDLHFVESKVIGVPQLADAVLNYECKAVHCYDAGEFTIVIGEILEIHTSSYGNLDKIYALGGQKYGTIGGVEVLQHGR